MTTFASDLYLLVAAYGLAIAVSYAGLPMLGQSAFFAVGAVATAQLSANGIPLGVAALFAVGIAAAGGYLVGFAAARLTGAPLALATWALAWLAYTAAVVFPKLSGGAQGLVRATPARLVSPSLGITVTLHPWVHVVAAGLLAVAIAVGLWRCAHTAGGLDLAALRTGPVLADSIGVPVQRRRRVVLAITGALGAVGGAGTMVLLGVAAPTDYSPLLALQLFVAVLVGGTATWWGPPIGVALLAAIPSVADSLAGAIDVDPLRARAVLTAALLVVVLLVRAALPRMFGWWPAQSRSILPELPLMPHSPTPATTPLLELHAVDAAYGGVSVLQRFDLDLRSGEVHALVGPNGSGKSTALRVAAGVVTPQRGGVRIGGAAAPAPGGAAPRVRAGVARTLQRVAALGELDAATQVAVGARSREHTPLLVLRELLATPAGRRSSATRRQVVASALTSVGLAARASAPTSQLDSAEQRLLQVARAVATGAPALLLDEPAAGMSAAQRARLVDVLRGLAARGHGVLLVEHDMAFVGRVADRVTVLAAGNVIATGPPDVVRRDPVVARAYLGEAVPSA